MLLGISPLLRGPLLAALDQMGHGDILVVADANFPAYRLGPPVFAIPGADNPAVLEAIAAVFPLDPAEPVSAMAPPTGPLPFTDQMHAALGGAEPFETIGRFEFYDLASGASAIVQTGELRPFGCIALRKGTIN
ncbi:MAG: L-fucose mutarotase [Bifidobacteriaceae bacterium]|jgi:L-fucose mutarotase|nr:L-fucose mutarotase [Bifidobacteriaceae bacterium]